MPNIAIYPFPYSSRNNKYVSLLYSNLSLIADDFGYEIINCENKFIKLLKLSSNSKKFHKNIIHIHWVNVVYGSRFLPKSVFLLALNFSLLFFLKKFKKFKIVWTKHNYFSHDFTYPVIDKIGRRIMLSLADKVIIQQKSEYEKVQRDNKFVFIPHGNYIDAYGPVGDRSKVRSKFGVGNEEILILSFGALKPYKKTENIIKAFRQSNNSRLKLLIAGKSSEKYAKILKDKVEGADNIIFNFNFIEDEEIPDYFAAADFSVFWYDDSVLTSGGIILSLSYGTPVISRNMPAGELIKDKENGFIYGKESQLASIFGNLNPDQFDREKVITSVENLSWNLIAKKLADEFLKI